MTYKIGMRRALGAAEGRSFPWLGSAAPTVEVAADFTCIYRILMWKAERGAENRQFSCYQSTSRTVRLWGVWQ